MANYTQKAILQTFEEMLEKMPFDKITVSAIVARCEISSNTFYYHFHDIYDLLDIWLDKKREFFLNGAEETKNWPDRLKVFLRAMQDSPSIVYHISNSISRERLEHYVFTSVEDDFYKYVNKMTAGMDITDETVQMLTNFFCYSLLGYFLKFLWIKMDVDVDSSVDNLVKIYRGVLTSLLTHNSDENTLM